MTLHLRTPVVLQLRDAELLPLDASVHLAVRSGRVWVTRAGDPHDHFLDAGESISLRPGDAALVGGEGEATIALRGPTRWSARAWQAAAQWWRDRRRARRAAAWHPHAAEG